MANLNADAYRIELEVALWKKDGNFALSTAAQATSTLAMMDRRRAAVDQEREQLLSGWRFAQPLNMASRFNLAR
jgi:hypothetical protein